MNEEGHTISLTAEGYRRLRQRLDGYTAQLRLLRSSPPSDEAHDFSDQADRLESADDLSRLADQIAVIEDTLSHARPLAAGPDDGVVRHGSAVLLRDEQGSEHRFTLLAGVELESNPEEISLDSPLGQALLGHRAGDQLSVRLPHGDQQVTLVSVEPYRAAAR